MSEREDFRPLPSIELRRVFTSMGLPVTAFRNAGGTTAETAIFDAVLNADASRPNGLWLFKGADYFLYNLETGDIEDGPQQIAGNVAGDTLPQVFRTGIHSAVWAGPAFPEYWYLFKDEYFLRANSHGAVSEKMWQVDYGPRGILGVFASGVWSNPDGTWQKAGVPVALHGLGSKFNGMIHFFKNGQYVRHNLFNGTLNAGPMPIKEAWNLPDEFSNRIDLSFYGVGPNKENIYFISGQRYVLYDFRRNQVINDGLVEKRFPAFAQFIGRPQLFLMEDYTLETFVGPPHMGRLLDTRTIGAGSKITKILVTETSDTSKSKLTQSLLQSQETSVVNNFYDKLDKNTSASRGSESYKYQLDSSIQGEASANSLWGGEFNASLNVKGGTDTLRSDLSEATFKSIQSQVDESTKQTEQKTYNSETEISQEVHVLRKEIFEETNSSDKVRVYEFYEQLQSYVTLLVLRYVRVAYSDGTEGPKIVELQALQSLLGEVLVDADQQQELTSYLGNELADVADQEGKSRSLIVGGSSSSDLVLDRNLTSTYPIHKRDGTVQSITVRGVIKADKTWVEPTYTIAPVQRTGDASQFISAASYQAI